MIRPLDIKSREQIENINRLASNAPYEVWLSTDTAMLDARSLLSIYTLIGQRVNVVAEDDVNPKHFGHLVDKMSA